ncbi:helix-turn-helix domain-containing protein [Eisenbergiella tayi]|uniref:helix-turn-helix domain-containing protein n=1 Tax=Eisenbergiella tayi TaxID=1432052 RepID=UPI00242A3B21|nr:helix-turn-helix transcriptional regulator [Eisenbergiella tayi]
MRIYKSFFRFEKCRKACKYRLYRLMRTYKEIVKNYILISTTFKEFTGENFSSYLRKLRIEKSKKFLLNTDMSILEISQKVGFEDARRFAKVFKEETGLTPTASRDKRMAEKK